MDVALTRVFKFNTRQCARQHPEYLLVSALITYANSLCLWIKLLPQCAEGNSKVLLIRCSQGIFFGGGGEILREINGQDHRTSMAKISASICSIWSRSLRSSVCIGKQCSRHQQYVVENHKNIKQCFRTDRASAHSDREPCIWPMMTPKVIYKPH